MTAEEKLSALLREARIDGGCGPDVERRLVAALRQRQRRQSWPLWMAAAAAVVVAVWLIPQPKREVPTPTQAVSKPSAKVAELPPVVGTGKPVPNRTLRRAPLTGREVTTPFYALDAGAVGESPRGYVMRVRVPRATMASFGLPVNAELADRRVDADVLVGSDGTARAIRFVQMSR